MGRAALAALATLALLAPACGAAEVDPPGPDAAVGTVELGTGETSFVPLVPEADLELVAGPQGGHHFIVHARLRGLDPGDPDRAGIPENPATRFAAFAEDGHQLDVMYPPYRLGYVASVDGAFDLPGGRILQIDESQVSGLVGQRVRVTVAVTDQAGREADDERWVRASQGPADAGPAAP